MDYNPGSRWKSSVSSTEVVIVRKPGSAVSLACGGAPMVPMGEEGVSGAVLNEAFADETQLGKRYVDDETGTEVLCTKAGVGTLAVDERPLHLQGAKPLPASD